MLECDLTPLELVDSQQLFQLRKDLNKWGKKLTLNSDNGPFAEYGHMVQKKPWWMEDDPVKGHFTLE